MKSLLQEVGKDVVNGINEVGNLIGIKINENQFPKLSFKGKKWEFDQAQVVKSERGMVTFIPSQQISNSYFEFDSFGNIKNQYCYDELFCLLLHGRNKMIRKIKYCWQEERLK